jgi:hypothetical protein
MAEPQPLGALDAACAAHLQHDAMAGADPHTDELIRQLSQAAQAAGLATASTITPEQARAFHEAAQPDPVFDRWQVYAAALAAGLLLSAIWPMGCAR